MGTGMGCERGGMSTTTALVGDQGGAADRAADGTADGAAVEAGGFPAERCSTYGGAGAVLEGV